MKAKFIDRLKCGKNENDILVYEYKGYRYTIEDIPPYKREAWYFQNCHKTEQNRIDLIISQRKQKENIQTGLNLFFNFMEG